jgi:hypothetical protein
LVAPVPLLIVAYLRSVILSPEGDDVRCTFEVTCAIVSSKGIFARQAMDIPPRIPLLRNVRRPLIGAQELSTEKLL